MLDCQKDLFQLPEDLTYLNCAYMGPLLKKVSELGKRHIDSKLDPSKISPIDFFEPTNKLRAEFASLINCNDPNRVVVIPSVSYGLSTVAKNTPIPQNSNIILAGEQFPSNAYTWFRAAEQNGAQVNTISAPKSLEGRGKKWNEKILDAIDDQTSVVALAHCHWADGTLFDLKKIRVRTSEVGAALVIDGTQSVGALPFDWNDIQPDALICAGYKWLLGPYSIGLACYNSSLDKGIPLEENWMNRKNSEDFAGLVDYQEEYQPVSLRYEVGEHSNFISLPMLRESVSQIQEWGVSNIQDYCKSITSNAFRRLEEKGFWIEDRAYRSSHLVGVRMHKDTNVDHVKMHLEQEGFFVSIRGNSVRIAPNVYNTEEELNNLADCLITYN